MLLFSCMVSPASLDRTLSLKRILGWKSVWNHHRRSDVIAVSELYKFQQNYKEEKCCLVILMPKVPSHSRIRNKCINWSPQGKLHMGNCENDSYTTHFERKFFKKAKQKKQQPHTFPFPISNLRDVSMTWRRTWEIFSFQAMLDYTRLAPRTTKCVWSWAGARQSFF